MCDCTHHEASLASTNTPARDLSADSNGNNQANAGGNSRLNETLNGPQSELPPHLCGTLADYAKNQKHYVAEQFAPGTETGHESMQFMHLDVEESGLLIEDDVLFFSGFNVGDETSVALFDGTAVITTDHHKKALIRAAQELQLRQDEIKEDFSDGIVLLLKAVCGSLLSKAEPKR